MATVTINGSKAQYQRPTLAIYGGFSRLTAAGSGDLNEGPNQGPMAKAARKL